MVPFLKKCAKLLSLNFSHFTRLSGMIKHAFLLHDYCYVYPRVAVLGLPVARQVRKYTHIFKDIATNIKTVIIYPYHAEDFGGYKER